ncbi:hypothetical protein HU200_008686 [Digitaria exilis]|uniref:C2H2-type domain-containing protein n=1 Tax=Digitaria exilis TaxID=1010633 RepID=A0A835KQ32_9POAL|nr:hypothetical protein HU200_008686 [Digitaria exilis]
MDFGGQPDKANDSANQESHGEHFVRRVASSGLVIKFKVDKYGTHPSESDIPYQKVVSNDRENVRHTINNVEVNCAQNVTQLLEQSEIREVETCRDAIPFLENAILAHQDHGINRALSVDNSATVADNIVPLESITEDCGAIKLNETSSSENAKMNVMTGNFSPENFEIRMATENGSSFRSNVHICYWCGKSFEKKISLDGHIGSHLREDYKLIRMTQQEPIPVQNSHNTVVSLPMSNNKKKPTLKHFWEASRALEDMSMAPVWHPKHGTATIDLSTSVTFSSDEHSSGEAAEMTEAADFLTKLVERICKEAGKVPLPSSGGSIVCRICNKMFSSYQALGGHMSIHNKHTNSMHVDSASSSSGKGEKCTPEYVCTKCQEKFPTGQLLGAHKRMHYYEEYEIKSPADGNMKPLMPVPRETLQSSGPVIQPTDVNMLPPVLPASNKVQPTWTEQSRHANRLVNETEPPSSIPDLNLQPHESDDRE